MTPAFDDHGVISHVTHAITAAVVEEDPFPHLIVPGLFPVEVFQAILAKWPDEKYFVANRSMNRHDLKLRRSLEAMPEDTRRFWQQVLGWTAAANRAIARRLAPHIRHKYELFLGSRWQERSRDFAHVVSDGQLSYYTGTTKLEPHVDHPRLVTNAFCYCSEASGAEPELGTVLYAGWGFAIPDNRIVITPKLAERALRRAKVVPYQSNLCFAYLNTPRAFHAVDPMDLGVRRRRVLMFGCSLNPASWQRFVEPITPDR